MINQYIILFNHLIKLLNDYDSSKLFYKLMEEVILEEQQNYSWTLNMINIDLSDFDKIIKIISEIEGGNKEYLKEFNNVRLSFIDLLIKILRRFKTEHDYRRGWRYRCPDCYFDLYNIEIDLMDAIEELITYTKKPLIEIFELMNADEKIGLKSLCRQSKICEDIEIYIGVFVGN
jgi:hypothetical protein